MPQVPGFPYQLVRRLGVGGMGAVYEVVRPGDARRLAAKLLTLTSPQARARFEREGQLVARLDHPGIIPVLASGIAGNGTPYLIFELVDGRSLKAVIEEAQRPLDEATVLDWGEQLARALGSAHARGIVHRDVKPANIMLDGAGRVRVADFGIALASDLDRLTKTGQLAGTPLYMAPEQFTPDVPVGPWTDVHAVGAVLFEALTGQAPHEAPTAANVVASILGGEVPPIRSLRRDVSAGLAAVIARCLEKAPGARYEDGGALAEDLGRLRRGERVSAVSMFLRAARRRVMRRTTVGGLALLVLVGLPLAGWVALRRARLEQARDEAAARAAGELDSLAAQVRPDASARALELAERDLARAAALLEDVPDGPVRARLVQAMDGLDARRRVAVASARAYPAMKAGAQDPVALAAALEALALVPPPTTATEAPGPDVVRREEARAWLLYLAGRLEQASAAASRLSPAGAGGPGGAAAGADALDAEEWLADPGRRTLWLSTWCALRQGDVAALRRLSEQLPAPLRARLAAAEAAVADDPAASRATARQLIGVTPGPEADLVRAALQVDELLRAQGLTDLARALEVLLEVRLLSAPPSPRRVPRAVQAQASLLEGEVHLAIGWAASAAEAFARSIRLASGAPHAWPAAPASVPAEGGRRRVLLAPDSAARLGEALARALLPDREAALAAAQVAAARGALDAPALAAERAAALCAFLEGAVPADPTTPAALQLAGVWPDVARGLAAAGAADLAAAFARDRRVARAAAEGKVVAPGTDPAPLRRRAREALRLAERLIEGDPDERAEEAAVPARLARAELALGDLTAASAALARAEAQAPGAFETLLAAAHVALAQGQPEGVVERAQAALAALEAEGRRLIEQGELTMSALLPLIAALEGGGYQVDALPLVDLASRCADRDRLPVEARAMLHERLQAAARVLRRDDLARAAAERLARLQTLAGRLNAATRLVSSQTSAGGQLVDTPELRQAFTFLLRENPQAASTYVSNHMFFGRLRGEGFDNLALGFECNAGVVIAYLNDPSFALRRMSATTAAAAAGSVLLLTEPMPPDPSLPVPRDEALRVALAGLYCADLRIPLEPARLAACLRSAREAWERRPMSEPASLALGRLLIVAGAAAEALPLLRRPHDLIALSSHDQASETCWAPLYEALAWASLGDLDQAQVALASARDRRLSLSHRIREEPLLWEDQALPGTLYPWAAAIAAEVEAQFGSR